MIKLILRVYKLACSSSLLELQSILKRKTNSLILYALRKEIRQSVKGLQNYIPFVYQLLPEAN